MATETQTINLIEIEGTREIKEFHTKAPKDALLLSHLIPEARGMIWADDMDRLQIMALAHEWKIDID